MQLRFKVFSSSNTRAVFTVTVEHYKGLGCFFKTDGHGNGLRQTKQYSSLDDDDFGRIMARFAHLILNCGRGIYTKMSLTCTSITRCNKAQLHCYNDRSRALKFIWKIIIISDICPMIDNTIIISGFHCPIWYVIICGPSEWFLPIFYKIVKFRKLGAYEYIYIISPHEIKVKSIIAHKQYIITTNHKHNTNRCCITKIFIKNSVV